MEVHWVYLMQTDRIKDPRLFWEGTANFSKCAVSNAVGKDLYYYHITIIW